MPLCGLHTLSQDVRGCLDVFVLDDNLGGKRNRNIQRLFRRHSARYDGIINRRYLTWYCKEGGKNCPGCQVVVWLLAPPPATTKRQKRTRTKT